MSGLELPANGSDELNTLAVVETKEQSAASLRAQVNARLAIIRKLTFVLECIDQATDHVAARTHQEEVGACLRACTGKVCGPIEEALECRRAVIAALDGVEMNMQEARHQIEVGLLQARNEVRELLGLAAAAHARL